MEFQSIVAAAKHVIETKTNVGLGTSAVAHVLFASGLREVEEMFLYMFRPPIARRLLEVIEEIRLDQTEISSLFLAVHKACSSRSCELSRLKNTNFGSHTETIEKALRCTLQEDAHKERWSNDGVKCTSLLAMNMSLADEALESSVGAPLRSDSRRLDDLKTDIECNGSDIVTIHDVITSITTAVIGTWR